MSLRIGIDIDGCVYNWTRAVNDALMSRDGIDDPGPHLSWDYLKSVITPEQWAWWQTPEAVEVVYGRLDLIYPQAADVVNALAEEHEVHFITHRDPHDTGAVTARFLAQHFRNYRGVHVLDNSCPKWELGRWDVFIDDKPETVQGFIAHTGAMVLMPSRPWNADYRESHQRPWRLFGTFDKWDEVAWLIAEAVA